MTPFLTPCNCKQKFHDLKRRYTHELARHQNDAVGDDKTEIEIIPWLNELRKHRITELQRELEHYDLSIVFAYAGIDYSSPTLATAMGNLIPAFTFVFAVTFRMESLDIRKLSSQAKILGTIIAISGAFVMTLYKGQVIHIVTSPSNLPQHQLLSLYTRQSNWVLGGICLAITCICSSLWNILQTATIKAYPDEMTVVFFFCCFGTIQCAIFSLIVERNPGAWTLRPGIGMIAIIFAALFGSVFRTIVFTWCLRKKGPVYVSMFKPLGMVIAVILGLIFLGDALHLGSIIGGTIIAVGFYTVMWGKAQEKYMVVDAFTGLESSMDSNPLLQK